jgi:hypothetical protein
MTSLENKISIDNPFRFIEAFVDPTDFVKTMLHNLKTQLLAI